MNKPALLFLVLLWQQVAKGQELFTDNFNGDSLSPQWQIINGRWHIADVQTLKIAPVENGGKNVVCSNGDGYLFLIVDIPDSVKATKIKLRFGYYNYANGPTADAEVEFHKRNLKDGIKGKLWKKTLPKAAGRWQYFEKIFLIP